MRKMSWLSDSISSPFIYNSKVRYLASWPRHIKESKSGEEKAVRAMYIHDKYQEVKAGLGIGKLYKKQKEKLKNHHSLQHWQAGKSVPFSTHTQDLDCEPVPAMEKIAWCFTKARFARNLTFFSSHSFLLRAPIPRSGLGIQTSRFHSTSTPSLHNSEVMSKVPRDSNNVETLVSWALGPWVTCTHRWAHCCPQHSYSSPSLGSLLLLIQSWRVKIFLQSSAWLFFLESPLRQSCLGSGGLHLCLSTSPLSCHSPHSLQPLPFSVVLPFSSFCPGVHLFLVWRIILLHACFHTPSPLSFTPSANPLNCSKNLGLWNIKARQMYSLLLPSAPSYSFSETMSQR